MTTVDQQAALEKTRVNRAWFVELQFASGTVRVCNYSQTFSWGGYDWIGLGSLGGISAINESSDIGSSPVMFTLNIAQISVLQLAIVDASEYRGRPGNIYFCPLQENGALIDTPEQCWAGTMDTMSIGVDGEEGQITLKCETSAFNLKRRSSARINYAQQKQRYPSDTGLLHLNGLLVEPYKWLSRKFQRI